MFHPLKEVVEDDSCRVQVRRSKDNPQAFTLLRTNKDAKILSDRHSLIPLMKLRLATPAFLVDLHRISGMAIARFRLTDSSPDKDYEHHNAFPKAIREYQ